MSEEVSPTPPVQEHTENAIEVHEQPPADTNVAVEQAPIKEGALGSVKFSPTDPQDFRAPMEELIRITIKNNQQYPTREALTDEQNPHAMLFWSSTLSSHAKTMKRYHERKRGDGEAPPLQVMPHEVNAIYLTFNQMADDLLQKAALLDEKKRFHDVLQFNRQPPTHGLIPKMEIGPRSSTVESSNYPFIDICFSWACESQRFAKALQQQGDTGPAWDRARNSMLLFQKCLAEDAKHVYTVKVLQRVPKVLELCALLKPTDKFIREQCDVFLVQFSNFAMRGELEDQLTLKPLITMALSDNKHIRESDAIAVIRHFAEYFNNPIGVDARKQRQDLETMVRKKEDKESLLKRSLTPEAKKRLAESGITREEIFQNTDIIISLLNWKGRPRCALTCDPLPLFNNEEPDPEIEWTMNNPRKLFTDTCKLTADENPNAFVILAKKKQDNVPVAIKVFKNFTQFETKIRSEIEYMRSFRHQNLSHLLDVYLYENEIWIVMEYCDAGNLVDLVPVAQMKEEEIVYVAKEVLQCLQYLHTHERMHRDLTSDDILLNLNGDVLIADFEITLGKDVQRYWLSPELLLQTPKPYGSEVDIWSLGCILVEMCDGRPPYADFHPLKEFFYTATKGAPPLEKPNNWSPEFRDFLSHVLDPDPGTRWTASKLLEHPVLQKACSKQEFAQTVQFRVSWTRW